MEPIRETELDAQPEPPGDPVPDVDVVTCLDPDPQVTRLESYFEVEVPGRYWIDMVYNAREWVPAEPMDMPHHHATRLQLTNPDGFPALATHRNFRLRFTIDVQSRTIHTVYRRHAYRTTYEAIIVSICQIP